MADTLREHLEKQGQTLEDLNKNVKGLSGSISQMVRQTAEANLRAREERNDARLAAMAAQRGGGAPAAGGGTSGGAGGGRDGKVGFMDRVGQGLGLGTGFAAVKAAGKRLGVAALMQMSADFLGDQVEEATGSADLGDATQRALKLGSFGVLFGKRIGAISAFIGAVATDENIDQLKSIGNKIDVATEDVQKWFSDNGFPSLEQALDAVSESVNRSLNLINNILDPDVPLEDVGDKELDVATKAAFGYFAYKKTPEILAALKGPELPTDYEFSKTQRNAFNKDTYSNLNRSQRKKLDRLGLKMDKAGRFRNASGFLDADAVDDMFRQVGAKGSGNSAAARASLEAIVRERAMEGNPRYKQLMKYAKRIPYIGTLLGGATFAGILSDENTSKEEKIKEGTALVAGTLGAAGGAALGAMIAGWAGAPTGPGALLTAAVGGIAGAVSTEALARMLMEELIGGGDGSQTANTVTTLTQNANGGGGVSGGTQGTAYTLPPTSGARVTSVTSESSALAGVPNYIIMDNSQKSISAGGSGATSMFNFGGSAFYDQFDPLAGTRTVG
jgi:hypothetical protein